jgi:glycosyltransferase involved in cell wall biosynthesis
MRIAYVLWFSYKNYHSGGEEYAEKLCKYLSSRGHEVYLISPPVEPQTDIGKTKQLIVTGPLSKLWTIIKSPFKLQVNIGKTTHLTIKNVSLRRVISGLTMGLWSLSIPSTLAAVDPDVVISHNIFPPYFCQKWADKHGKIFINNFHHVELPIRDPVLGWRYPLFKLFNLNDNCIFVAVSHYQKQLMESFMKKVHYIGMGYDPAGLPRLPKENIILYLGKIDKMKQVPLLLKAWKNVDHNDWKLILAGDGSDYDYCVNYAKNINLTDYEFLGYVADEEKWRLYSGAKLFAFPSLYEGYGIVLLEALDGKTVPIVNDLPPMNEVITPELGFVTKPTIDAWAETLHIAMSSDLAKKMVHAPEILSEYRWETVCKRLEQTIETYTNK